ncbi:MAG: peptidoglycan-binding protein [Acidimicrobiaceae bacterium]|nr:peptidoglycan-binding protein [Acidimicrobiaceae bacterium]
MKDFETSRGLTADGIVGAETWAALVEGGIGDWWAFRSLFASRSAADEQVAWNMVVPLTNVRRLPWHRSGRSRAAGTGRRGRRTRQQPCDRRPGR